MGASFEMYEGESKLLDFTITDASTGAAVNITGSTITWVMCSLDGTKKVTKTTSSGISITNGAAGKFRVTLAPSDTAGFAIAAPKSSDRKGAASVSYWHEAKITDTYGNVSVTAQDIIVVYKSYA